MKTWFERLAQAVCRPLPGAGGAVERTMLHVAAEHSDFVRFNRGAVRQMTRVEQYQATVTLVAGQRRAACRVSLSGNAQEDIAVLLELSASLSTDLPMVPPDPHLQMPQDRVDTCRDDQAEDGHDGERQTVLPPAEGIAGQVLAHAAGLDLVGFYAAGPVVVAFADSRGQRNWHRVRSFHFEWSLYCQGDPAVRDRAVKSSYAGTAWDAQEFGRRMTQAKRRLALLERPARALPPGDYRTWLEPAAVGEILSTLAWGGFGIKERRTGTSSLAALDSGERALSSQVMLAEATSGGIAPAFTASGHVRPDTVPLVAAGRNAQTLVSPRSAAEFGLVANADEGEFPASLDMAGGALAAGDAPAALGSGLWIGNLWYLNYSDRRRCRMTGMTRFASFWVEDGELVAPIAVMRFDDSVLRLFGDALLDLSRETELQPSSDTYDRRHLGSVRSPGALLADMRFTL
ncbi:MAG: metallopeptidase TldD-related protein [Lautropia sp.]